MAINHEKAELVIIIALVGYIYLSGGLKSFGINPPEGFSFSNLPFIGNGTNPFHSTPTGPYCGDGYCDFNESFVNCPQDCGSPSGAKKYGPEFQGMCNATQVCSGLVSPDYLMCKDLEGNCQSVRGGTPCYDAQHKNIGECCWC